MSDILVIDASFIFRLLAPGPHQSRFQTQAADWQQQNYEWYAPSLWVYEVTSALCKMAHFGELTGAEAQHLLALAHKLDIQTMMPDDKLTQLALNWTVRLKRTAAYDSFYLALAQTLQCDFWTADRRLYNAVGERWVHYLG